MPAYTHTHPPSKSEGSDQQGKGRAEMKSNPWFRMYTEAVDDEKLRLLAFEDRWHYVAILCCKSGGILDDGCDQSLLRRKVAVKMGVQIRELEEIARRLSEVGLIDQDTLQPVKWSDRQFESDSSKDRMRRYRERQRNQQLKEVKRNSDVTVTVQETDTDTDTDKNRGKTAKRFVPPTPDEVSTYCKQRNNSVDAGRFVDFYAAKGWMVGKNKMKDWKAAVRTWEANSKTEAPARKRKML